MSRGDQPARAMADLQEMFDKDFFTTPFAERRDLVFERLHRLTEEQSERCLPYGRMLASLGYDSDAVSSIEELPYLPVRMFKEYELMSIPKSEVFKVMTSSGTSGQQVSKIFLDKETASHQTKALTGIVNTFIGKKRLPMLIIDCPSVLKNRAAFSARGAGVLGFSMFGRERVYALRDDMSLDREAVEEFLAKHAGSPIFLFGFTFMIWSHFVEEARRIEAKFDLSGGVLFHGGGWKKLVAQRVSEVAFKARLQDQFGLKRVYNYYGMVEQTGSIFVECEEGHMHASILGDVRVRSPRDLSVLAPGERGILQVFSALPSSYPGHSLLTEDEGEVVGWDGCPCGRTGTYFKIYGRLQNAEIRGCSDTYERPVRAS